MLDTSEPYVTIWGEDRGKGIVYGQDQDDGTGRSVRKNFNNNGYEVDGVTGKIIDRQWVSPEQAALRAKKVADAKAAAAKATAESDACPLTLPRQPQPERDTQKVADIRRSVRNKTVVLDVSVLVKGRGLSERKRTGAPSAGDSRTWKKT